MACQPDGYAGRRLADGRIKMKVTRTQHVDLEGLMKYLSSHQVNVGFFETDKYADGTPVAYVAAIQEFGYPEGNIPSRPFFRNAIKANERKWEETAGRLVLSATEGRIAKEEALNRLGAMAAGDVQESILDGSYEPLKQSTLDARQSRKRTKGVGTKPLIDTSHMMDQVKHVVEKK